jgi:hypothetical protein
MKVLIILGVLGAGGFLVWHFRDKLFPSTKTVPTRRFRVALAAPIPGPSSDGRRVAPGFDLVPVIY